MNIRNGRLRTFAVLGTLTPLAFSTVQAGQIGGTENQLLGITLRTSTFRDVLKKYGQPDEVQGGGPFLPTPPKETATAAGPGGGRGGMRGPGGKGMPGMAGMPGSGGMPGSAGAPGSGGGGLRGGGAGAGGKRVTSKNGFPGENDGNAGGGGAPGSGGGPGRGGYPGGPSSGGYPGGPGSGGYPGAPGSGGYPGGPGSGGYPGGPGSGGYPGSGGGKGGGLPGFPSPGGGGDNGPGSGGGLPGAGESGGSEEAAAPPSSEATWWYHSPQKGYHMSFLFNKDGRVIQIQEYGVASLHSGKTHQGIALGSNMTQVLSRYGWSNDGAHSGENVIMRYGGSDKVAFQMVKNRVLGITVAVGH